VVAAPLVVVVVAIAPRVVVPLLFLLICPSLHHVAEFHDGLGALVSEVQVDRTLEDAVVEAVDDVLVGDVGNGGVRLEEAVGVGV
jgi:hypothetical protein